MDPHWIILANAFRARVCAYDAASHRLTELADFVHPQSRVKASELGGDRAGHVEADRGMAGRGGTQLDPRTDAHQREHERFARELAAYIDDAVATRRCSSWSLFASNPFLGELKAQLDSASAKALRQAHAVDLTSFEGAELSERVDAALATSA